ncbi:MAG: type II methionyl aminopeptidase [Archaeoglobaceae archaeon]|nr:type II methionyl aminopeptidase [Archaeoglobaceae archaeon]MDW8127784.1 type II methionyl aminopeptidase [Archaeoglobaceae archaeon]
MNEEALEKTIKAGEILKQVFKLLEDKVVVGAKLLEVAEFAENKILELGAKPAFPCNISINSDAAHFTPAKNDQRTFKKGDLVKIDLGAHIDGYIADMAVSIDLGDHSELIKASKEAVFNAIDAIKVGVDTAKLGKIIEETIRSYGFKPVVNLTGHGLMPYIAHAPPSIYNYATQRGVELKEGMVIAIEPFATNGVGRVAERGECEIYSLLNPKPVRLRMVREMLNEISEKYKTLPFAKRWLKKAPEIFISKLVREGVLRDYPVLSEVSGGIVSQWEHTVIVEKDSARLVTL